MCVGVYDKSARRVIYFSIIICFDELCSKWISTKVNRVNLMQKALPDLIIKCIF